MKYSLCNEIFSLASNWGIRTEQSDEHFLKSYFRSQAWSSLDWGKIAN